MLTPGIHQLQCARAHGRHLTGSDAYQHVLHLHVCDLEDMLQGHGMTGHWRIESLVCSDPENAGVFKGLLQDEHGPDALQRLFGKQVWVSLPGSEMQSTRVRITFQPPGFTKVKYAGARVLDPLAVGVSHPCLLWTSSR